MSWNIANVRFKHRNSDKYVLKDISLEITPGSFTAILGPNGAGKSSLLNILLGLNKPEAGSVNFKTVPINQWKRSELAKQIGVVAQTEEISFPLSVRDVVGMGRYPHLGPWKRESKHDEDIVSSVMQTCDVFQFADRDINTLSGGEKQRVRIARALAQQPDTLALDEPTAALDIAHEMAAFNLLKNLAKGGMTVMLITHHINLAARYADSLAVLHNGAVAASGPPAEVLKPQLIQEVWKWPAIITPHPGPGPDTGAPQVVPISK